MFVTSPKCVIFVAYYSYEGVLIALPTYSPKCLEESFCELRLLVILRTSALRGSKKFYARIGERLTRGDP